MKRLVIVTKPIDCTAEGIIWQEMIEQSEYKVTYKPMLDKEKSRPIKYELKLLINDISVGHLIGGYFIDAFRTENWEQLAVLSEVEIKGLYQGEGYGTLFIRVYLSYLKSIGTKKVIAKKARYDKRLVRFYKQFGFSIDNRDIELNI